MHLHPDLLAFEKLYLIKSHQAAIYHSFVGFLPFFSVTKPI